MRTPAFVLLATLCLVPWQGAVANPVQGQVTKADPQLLQSYWTSLSVRDGLRERDQVRIEHQGQLVGTALVVSVTADHSVIMLQGANPAAPTPGDAVVLSKQASAVPVVAQVSPAQSGYKVMGGHSLVQIFTFAVAPTAVTPTSFSTDSMTAPANFSVGTFGSSANFSSSVSVSNSLGFGPFTITPTTFGSGFSAGSGISTQSNWGF